VPEIPEIAGVKLATAAAGIRYHGRTDALLAVMDQGTTVAGVFTKSKCPSAPVEWCRTKLGHGKARPLVVNSGQCQCLHRQDRLAGDETDGRLSLASTGVIGEPLDATKFNGVLGTLSKQAVPGEWMNAAKAIMTTDTFTPS
jgi:glutamate N-acetyltransferase/amino-acid N-acetyltransferase